MTVDQSDLDFATLMYDAVIFWQDRFFGRMLQESWDNAENENKPRRRRTRNANILEALPREFVTQQLEDLMKLSKAACGMQLKRWEEQGLVEKIQQGTYRKKGER